MGCVIAMAGKGGTGKTTIAALIVRIIKEEKLGSVIAIDADPNSNLGEVLGIEAKENIGQILDEISAHPESVPGSMGKDAYIDYRLQTAIAEGDGFDLLTMGRPEGPGCYCYVNNALRNSIGKLVKDYDFVVIDNEAGLEHLSRRTIGEADSLLIISDASVVGLRAAKRITDLTSELKIRIKNKFLIVNRSDSGPENRRLEELNLEYLGFLPADKEIEKASVEQGSLSGIGINNPSINALRKLGEKIWHCN